MTDLAHDVEQVNDALDILSHHHRRFVLAFLQRSSPAIDVDRLAARIDDWQRDVDGVDRPSREAVAVELHHRHLPRLDDSHLLTYRPDETTVADWRPLDLPEGWLASPSVEPVLGAILAE